MNVLAVLLLAGVIVGISLVLSRRPDLSLPSSLSRKELINAALLGIRSMDEHMADLKESFRPSAYMSMGEPMAWTGEVRERLRERLEHVKMCLHRMRNNIRTFDELGSLAAALTIGEDQLALEIVTKAAGCNVELAHLSRRIWIYDHVPISLWRALGKNMANNCLNIGNDLIQQYNLLVESVLAFARARGESYQYESLLSAL